MINSDWAKTEKMVDSFFKGSLWEKLGYEDKICPTCKAHIYDGICLNGCHLSKGTQQRFNTMMKEAAEKVATLDNASALPEA